MNDSRRNLQVERVIERRGRHAAPASGTAEPLRVCVERALEAYFDRLDGEAPKDLHAMVIAEVEAPLLAFVLDRAGGNQSVAAAMLGINRGTLRKKLKQYGLLD